MSKEEFLSEIDSLVEECPRVWRRGQAVFNVVELLYGSVAREVQFEDKIDCFYVDSNIDDFLNAAWERVNKKITV